MCSIYLLPKMSLHPVRARQGHPDTSGFPRPRKAKRIHGRHKSRYHKELATSNHQTHTFGCSPVRWKELITHRAERSLQVGGKQYSLGFYNIEADAAMARDTVASVLGRGLNLKQARRIVGERSVGADTLVADAVKAAKALELGTTYTLVVQTYPSAIHTPTHTFTA